MKGFIISVDAMIGLIIAFGLLLSITMLFGESRFSSLQEIKLAGATEDVLTVLEKNWKLENAVEENKNKEISKYLNKTSKNLCFELNVFDFEGSSSALSTVTKNGCKKSSDVSVISIKRSFYSVKNNKFYWAELKAWNA